MKIVIQVTLYVAFVALALLVIVPSAMLLLGYGISAYELVVKGVLSGLLNPLVLAFLGYAFAKASTNVVNNLIRAKKGDPVQELTLF